MRLLHFAAALPLAAALLVAAFTFPAFADGTAVTVPWGDIVNQLLPALDQILVVVILGLAAFASRHLPGWAQGLVTNQMLTALEPYLQQAVDWGIASVSGASKDKVLSIDVANSVVAQAVQFFVDHAPAFLLAKVGGVDMLRQKIIAMIQELLPDEATVMQGLTIVAPKGAAPTSTAIPLAPAPAA